MLRRYSVPISIVVHAVALAAIVATPFLAGQALPSPNARLVFAAAAAFRPEEPPAPVRAGAPAGTARPNVPAAPAESPLDIAPERTAIPDAGWRVGTIDGGLPSATGASVTVGDPPPASAGVESPEPRRVGGQIKEPRKIKNVDAIYPPMALAARVSGAVVLDAVIDAGGRVRDVTIRKSVPLLNRAAVDAVRQWEFTPTTLNGVAVPVVLMVTVTFTLR